MTWKKVMLEGDVPVLSDTAPVDTDFGAASAGVAGAASRQDHKHALGPLQANLDCNQKELVGQVMHAVASAPNSGSEVEGQIYYNSTLGDKHPYVWVP